MPFGLTTAGLWWSLLSFYVPGANLDRGWRAELLDELGAMADLVAGHADRELEHAIDLERSTVILVGARERGEATHDAAHPFDRLPKRSHTTAVSRFSFLAGISTSR